MASRERKTAARHSRHRTFTISASSNFTTGFEYVGPARPDDARKFGIV
jgi:hypothetical protein